MDETTGLLTILCQHVFHCDCLRKWRGTGCPVCRYEQVDGLGTLTRAHGHIEDGMSEKVCSVCQSESNLWIW
jgi:BRCA1-associated protein